MTGNQIKFCRECGSRIAPGSKFCDSCGASINSGTSGIENSRPNQQTNSTYTVRINRKGSSANAYETPNARSKKGSFGSAVVGFVAGVIVTLILVGLVAGKNMFQKTNESTTVSQSADKSAAENKPVYESLTGEQTANEQEISDEPTNYTIEKGTSYAYMSDEWTVYIATAITDSLIKIENWDKFYSSNKELEFSSDLGSYKINDRANGFSWKDEEHTAFELILQDKENSTLKKPKSVTFTINTSDSDTYKGTNYNKDIACYVFTNDDWHEYRAIPLSDNLVKIECWSRSNSSKDCVFGWDWCVIDTEKKELGFEWGDEERTCFTITAADPANKYYWKEETFVAFTLENPDYKYQSAKAYLEDIGK